MAEARRFLFVAAGSPFSMASGAEQRNSLVFEALRELGTVDVVQLEPGSEIKARAVDHPGVKVCHAQVVQSRWPGAHYSAKPGLAAAVEGVLGRPLSDYNAVVARRLWTACQLQLPPGLPLIADLDDFHYRYSADLRWDLRAKLRHAVRGMVHVLSRQQLKRLSGAFFLSELDRREVPQLPGAVLHNIPVNVKPAAPAGAVAAVPRVLFVGSLWYAPNRHAVDWFLAEVWPALKSQVPQAELQLIGAASPELRASWARVPGVSAPGFVDDLALAYSQARVVVAPVHFGGGSNIKVLEALGHGRPCVCSSFVLQPFADQLRPGEQVLSAKQPTDYVTQLAACLNRPQDFQTMAAQGQQVIQSAFSEATFRASVKALVTSVLNR